MARQRDYRAEYAKRIAHGIARGLSRSQSRGHPRVRESFASGAYGGSGERYDPRLKLALRDMLRGRGAG